VDQPQEIVAYVVFDPAVGKRELPQSLRFINPRELATAGIPWAAEHLPETARRGDWILRKGRRLLPVAGRGGFPWTGRGWFGPTVSERVGRVSRLAGRQSIIRNASRRMCPCNTCRRRLRTRGACSLHQWDSFPRRRRRESRTDTARSCLEYCIPAARDRSPYRGQSGY
jgi:hypothetical protein